VSPLAFGHLAQTPVAEPAPLGRQSPQQRAIRRIVRPPSPIPQSRPVNTE